MQNNDRLVQLTDANGNDIYPVTINPDDIARIEMTQTDPGEGSPLAANHFVAVYGASSQVQTADIANNAVTSDKIDFTTFIQSGIVEGTTVVGDISVHITFDNPFPSTNYLVFLQKNTGGNYAAMHPAVVLASRTTTGVDVNIWSPDVSTDFKLSWLAILVN